MSGAVKSVVRIALPIAGAFFGGPIGGAIGGAIGGGLFGGGVKGALMGAAGGYLGAGTVNSVIGTPAGAAVSNTVAGPTFGSGILGAATGGGVRALTAPITAAMSGMTGPAVAGAMDPRLLMAGNAAMSYMGQNTAEKASQVQIANINKGIAANKEAQAPYTQMGADATRQIGEIQADPAGYIQGNEFYKVLAEDAQRRLLANEATKGKLAAGGTQAELQKQLLLLGNGLVEGKINQLQGQANTGAAAAGNVGNVTANMMSQRGDVGAAGKVGAYNAMNTGYGNTINTMLALQQLQRMPSYAPQRI